MSIMDVSNTQPVPPPPAAPSDESNNVLKLEEIDLDLVYNLHPKEEEYQAHVANSWPRRQIITLFLIGIALTLTTNFPSAFTHTSVNTAFVQVDRYLNASYTQRGEVLEKHHYVWFRSIIGSSWYAGQVLGAQFSPFVTDRFGRKPAYIVSTAVMTFACALQSVATLLPYPEFLVGGRILASLFSPMSDAAAILYLQEISPTHLRGVLSSLFITTYSMMGFLGMILGTQSVLGRSLTLLLATPVIPGVLSLLMLFYLPETPKFLKIVKHKDELALKSLRFYQGIRGDNHETLESYAAEGKESGGSLLDIFKEYYLRRALACTIATTIPTLAFYPILQSSTYLLKKLSFKGHFAEYASVFMMIFLISSCILGAKCIDRFSRRKLLIFCSSSATFALIIFSLTGTLISYHPKAKYLALLGLFGYIVFYGLGLGSISFFIGPELTPLEYRSVMFSVAFSFNNILIVISSLCVQPSYEVFGSLCFIILFVLPNILAILFVYAYLPETKGRETHQIIAALRGGHFIKINKKKHSGAMMTQLV